MTDVKHDIRVEPQPMADQMMAKCSCGWQSPVSVWDFAQPGIEAHRRANQHVLKNLVRP